MAKQLIAVIGAGGHANVVRDVIMATEKYQVVAILDDKFQTESEGNGVIYAPIQRAASLIEQYNPVFIVAIGNNHIRQKMVMELTKLGVEFAVIIHPAATISPSAKIGKGTVIMPKGVVNANASIGEHVIINTAAIIEHDNEIGCFAHISPGAILTGNVQVGQGTHIGAGATIIPGKAIGNWTVIGANATVTCDMTDKVTAVGTPAKVIDKKRE